jgi:hypothetical protein
MNDLSHKDTIGEDEQFAIWDRWLEHVKGEITRLSVNRHIFWEVQEIIKKNPNIQKPSSFYEWMGNLYATDAVIGVRRLLDPDAKDISISLARLLTEIERNPGVISRQRFLSLYKHSDYSPDMKRHLEKLANRDFDRFAGEGKSHIDPSSIKADLLNLQEKAKNLYRYANKRVAHFDREALTELPTFNELNECLDFLETLLKKYMLLFRAVAYMRVLPVWQYDWRAIFREAWISGGRKG